MRVWDALFNEGPKILYRVALALLQMEEEVLLKLDNAGVGGESLRRRRLDNAGGWVCWGETAEE